MQRPVWLSQVWLIGGMLAVALTMSGCGVRSGLQTTEEEKAAKATETAGRKSAASEVKPGEPAPQKPHKPFVLDSLIR